MKDINLFISLAAFAVHFTFGFYRGQFKRFSRPWSRCLYIPIVMNIVVRRFLLDWDWQTAMVYLWPATLSAHILGGFLGSRRKSVTDTKEEKMKFILILSATLLLFTAPAFAELSVEDFEKIRTILKEEISEVETRLTKEIAEVETRLTEKINRSEEHLKVYVTQEVGKVDIKVDEMDKRLSSRIDEMDKQYDRLFTLVTVLLTAVIAIVGIPLALILYLMRKQERRERTQNERIEMLWRDLEERRHGTIITP